MSARVASADEASACERATIEAGTSSLELMRRAGHGAAGVIALKYETAVRNGVSVFAGPGNNGGDGWVVAESLAKRGLAVSVVCCGESRSDEARSVRDAAIASGLVRIDATFPVNAGVVVDALLGTGSSGSPRGDIAAAIAAMEDARRSGAHVVALDLPSGLDATTGKHDGSVFADSTVSFGTLKRGHLLARDICGDINVVDIGLIAADLDQLPRLVDDAWVHERVPQIPFTAHKGTRRSLAVVGGGSGMAGAAILCGEGALRSGIGLLRIVTSRKNIVAVNAAIPAAIAEAWSDDPSDLAALVTKVYAMAIGPGLGRSAETRDLVERILLAWSGPVVLDADALNDFSGDVASLGKLLRGRQAILTPHPAEMGRLISIDADQVLDRRFEIGADLARATGATVLLKGSPTVVFAPTGARYVIASGTAALATGGSGDVLTGIVGTLLAQMPEGDNRATEAAACAAFVHGRAAELCRFVRGVTLDDILQALTVAWNERSQSLAPGILARLESRS